MCETTCVCLCERVSVCAGPLPSGDLGLGLGGSLGAPEAPRGGSGPSAMRGGSLAGFAAALRKPLWSPHELPAAGRGSEVGRVDASCLVTAHSGPDRTVSKPRCAPRPQGAWP